MNLEKFKIIVRCFVITTMISSIICSNPLESSNIQQTQALKQFSETVEQVLKLQKQLERIKQLDHLSQEKVVIHIELSSLFKKLQLMEDCEYHLSQAFQLDNKNISVLFQLIKVKMQGKHSPYNEEIISYLQILQQNQNLLPNQYKLTDLKQLYENKKIAYERGYQFSHNWVNVIKQSKINFEFIQETIELKKIDGGFGLFATQQIPQNKIILVERSFFTMNEQTQVGKNKNQSDKILIRKYQKLSQISNTFHKKYLSMYNQNSSHLTFQQRKEQSNISNQDIVDKLYKNAYSIFQLSSLLKNNIKYELSGLFETTCLINHSCDSNLHYFFIGKHMIMVTFRAIKKGEQLTSHYIKTIGKTAQRRKRQLLKSWNFECHCDMCIKNQKNTDDKYIIKYFQGNFQAREHLLKHSKFGILSLYEDLQLNKLKIQVLNNIFKFGNAELLAQELGELFIDKVLLKTKQQNDEDL